MKKRGSMEAGGKDGGMTLVEVLTAFFLLMLASRAVLSCVSGYSRVINKIRELHAAEIRVEQMAGDAKSGMAAEIHLEISGEDFTEPGSYLEERVSDSVGSVFGFWTDQTVLEEIFADEE